MGRNIVLITLIINLVFWGSGCSQTIEGRLEQIQHDLKVGKFAQAEKSVEELVRADSLSPEALYGKALLDEYHSIEWDALLKNLEAAKMRDGYLPAMEAFIRLAIKLEYYESARLMARIFINRTQESPVGYRYMAIINVRQNYLDSARVYQARAAELGQGSPDDILLSAEIDFHTYDDEAIKTARSKLSKTRFETADQFRHLADLYHYLNLSDSAVFYGRRAVEKNGDDLNLRLQLAQYLFDENRLEEADQVISDVLADAADFGDGLILAAYIKWARGEEISAEQLFFKYVANNRQSPIPSEKHGDLYSFFGDPHTAVLEYQAGFVYATNLKYPDDYLSRTFLKMMNAMLDDHDIAAAVDYYTDGEGLLRGTYELMFLEAELKSNFVETADSARMMIDDRIGQFWNDARWLEMAGRYFTRKKNTEQAQKVYTRLLELPYPKSDYYLRLLDIYRENKNATAVEALVGRLPFRFRNDRRLQETLSDIYAEFGNKDKAAAYAEALYKHSSEYMPYILKLSGLYNEKGRRSEARKLFSTFTDQFPGKAEGFYQLARFDLSNGQTEKVPALVDRSLAIDTGYASSMELMGEYYQAKGAIDSAVAWYEKAVARNQSTPLAYHNLAEYYYEKGENLDRAQGLAMAAVRYFGIDRRGYILLGNIFYKLGNYRTAKLQFFKGVHLFPDDAEFHFLLGRAYVKLEDKVEAKKSLQQALELNLPSPQKQEAEKLLSGL